MDADTRFLWNLTRSWPLAWRLRMRLALVLYVAGMRRLAVRVMGDTGGRRD